MPVATKSVRIQSSCQYLFTLLGSTGAKAAHRALMKLTSGVNRNFDSKKLFHDLEIKSKGPGWGFKKLLMQICKIFL